MDLLYPHETWDGTNGTHWWPLPYPGETCRTSKELEVRVRGQSSDGQTLFYSTNVYS